jgi:PhzF family phenazine biosynthesis protein
VAEPDETLVEPLTEALGAAVSDTSAPRVIDVGAVWLIALVKDEATLRGLRQDLSDIDHLSRELGLSGVTAVALSTSTETPVVVRSFAPAAGIAEDPVCGSGNAAVGAFLADTGLLARVGPTYVSSQGREVGRDGAVSVHVGDEGRSIEIGGSAVTVIEGEMRLCRGAPRRRAHLPDARRLEEGARPDVRVGIAPSSRRLRDRRVTVSRRRPGFTKFRVRATRSRE